MFFFLKTHAPPEKAVFIRPSKNTPEETLRKLPISVRKRDAGFRIQGSGDRTLNSGFRIQGTEPRT
jgi:hypothetical protein